MGLEVGCCSLVGLARWFRSVLALVWNWFGSPLIALSDPFRQNSDYDALLSQKPRRMAQQPPPWSQRPRGPVLGPDFTSGLALRSAAAAADPAMWSSRTPAQWILRLQGDGPFGSNGANEQAAHGWRLLSAHCIPITDCCQQGLGVKGTQAQSGM